MSDKQPIKSLEQGRAEFAYRCAEKGAEMETIRNEYRQYVKKIPMLIKTNGLGATFAFVKAKKDPDPNKRGYAYQLIYEQTTEWLRRDGKNLIEIKDDLVEAIIGCDSPTYRAVTIEVLAFFSWLSRFAEGLIKEGGATDEQKAEA